MAWRTDAIVTTVVLLYLGQGAPARAQEPDYDKVWGSPNLLTVEDVQRELKLTDDQAKKVAPIARDLQLRLQAGTREIVLKFRNLPPGGQVEKEGLREALLIGVIQPLNFEANARLKGLLSVDQFRRYKQLSVWGRLPSVWDDHDLGAVLNLTGEQREKLRQIVLDNLSRQPRLDDIRKSVTGTKAVAERWRTLNRENNERTTLEAVAVLDERQRSVWKQVIGKPFPPGR